MASIYDMQECGCYVNWPIKTNKPTLAMCNFHKTVKQEKLTHILQELISWNTTQRYRPTTTFGTVEMVRAFNKVIEESTDLLNRLHLGGR
jgi:hypothetical protein